MFLDPQSKFRCQDIEDLVDSQAEFQLTPAAVEKVEAAAQVLKEVAEAEKPVYGVNTGFGRFAQLKIPKDKLSELQINLLRSHASGIGSSTSKRSVRRLILLRILSLGKAYSGISLQLLQRHIDFLNHELTPFIPEKGSVGASGDLAPLAHLGLSFIGEGSFLENGKRRPAEEIYRERSWRPLPIGPKEGLCLTNGTQFSLSLGMQVLYEWRQLQDWVEAACALSVEAFRATDAVYAERIHALKMHQEQQAVASRLSRLLEKSPHMEAHRDCEYVQDPYSFRCIPQVLGPCYSLISQAEKMMEDEINSISDNPLVFTKEREILSCGHFHAQAVSFACDLLSMAFVSIGNLIERRIDQLVNPLNQRLPAFLTSNPGVESGLMIVHTAVAALTSENKGLSFPASSDSITTNGNQEDHVSMAPNAAFKAGRILENLRRIVAGEILCAVRACVIESTRTGQKFSPPLEKLLAEFSSKHPSLFLSGDRIFSDDWYALEETLRSDCPISGFSRS